ncbi:MAG: hypothetical protein HYY52_00150 [Candidatus Melainabacteria bacterium]|nr:hypothetical protein [Candidatus Melainabacteria bacterium]
MFVLSVDAAAIAATTARTIRADLSRVFDKVSKDGIKETFKDTWKTADQIQKLQLGNGVMTAITSLISGTVTNPLTLIGIGLPIASFFLPWLIPVTAGWFALQALDSLKNTLSSAKNEGVFSFSTLLNAAATGLSIFCILPGVGVGVGKAFQLAKLKSFRVVKGDELKEVAKLGEALARTKEGLTQGITRLEKGFEGIGKIIKSNEDDLLKFITTGENQLITSKLIRDMHKALLAGDQEKYKQFRKLAVEWKRLQVAQKNADTMIKQLKATEEAAARIVPTNEGALAEFNRIANIELRTDYSVYSRELLGGIYGRSGYECFDRFATWFKKGKTAVSGEAKAAVSPTAAPPTVPSTPITSPALPSPAGASVVPPPPSINPSASTINLPPRPTPPLPLHDGATNAEMFAHAAALNNHQVALAEWAIAARTAIARA